MVLAHQFETIDTPAPRLKVDCVPRYTVRKITLNYLRTSNFETWGSPRQVVPNLSLLDRGQSLRFNRIHCAEQLNGFEDIQRSLVIFGVQDFGQCVVTAMDAQRSLCQLPSSCAGDLYAP